jgi:hypothetical protein
MNDIDSPKEYDFHDEDSELVCHIDVWDRRPTNADEGKWFVSYYSLKICKKDLPTLIKALNAPTF